MATANSMRLDLKEQKLVKETKEVNINYSLRRALVTVYLFKLNTYPKGISFLPSISI